MSPSNFTATYYPFGFQTFLNNWKCMWAVRM